MTGGHSSSRKAIMQGRTDYENMLPITVGMK